ncbi:MAG: peptidase BlaR1 [Caulobacteraceae bacterium]|nr:peptidase BlaR1 [Caulobacteraceae bacterium]
MAPASPTPAPINWRRAGAALTLALLTGAVLRLGVWAVRLRRAATIRRRADPNHSLVLTSLLAAQADRLGMRPPTLRLWDGAQPVLIGLIRPTILLPRRLATELEPSRLGLILAHELGHLRAGDPWRMALADLVCAVLWFNPFVRAASAGLAQAREEICDALALRGVDRPLRRAYAETLLAALQHGADPSPALAFIGPRRQAVRRMTAILKPAPISPRRAALCAGATALALTGSLGGLAYAAAGNLPAPARPMIMPPAPSAVDGVTPGANGRLQVASANPAPQSSAAVTTLQVARTGAVPAQNQLQNLATSEFDQARSNPLSAQAALNEARQGQGALVQLAQNAPEPRVVYGTGDDFTFDTRGGYRAPAPSEAPAPTTVTVVGTPRPPTVYTNADWVSKPTAAQMTAVYPPRALEAGIGGSPTLNCQVDVQGKVSGCRVVAESPAGEGFGAAALKLAPLFAMRARLQDGEPVAGTATIPLRFDPPAPPAP